MKARCVHFSARVDAGALHGIRCSAFGPARTYDMRSAQARDLLYVRCCVGGMHCPIRAAQRTGMEDGELIRRMAASSKRRREYV